MLDKSFPSPVVTASVCPILDKSKFVKNGLPYWYKFLPNPLPFASAASQALPPLAICKPSCKYELYLSLYILTDAPFTP